MAPFRSTVSGELLTSPTSRGVLSLEVAPRHVALRLADLQLAIADGTLILSRAVRRGVRRVVSPIRGRVVVARGLPREAVGLWHEAAPGQVERVFGVEPRDLITDDGLAALRQLDRLARRLGQAVADLGRGARSALEIGPPGAHGLDKVLVIDDGHRLTVYRRSLFRHRAERVLEATAGTSLLSALQGAGYPVSTSCGGVATCALCRVTVVTGREHLTPIVESEITHLGTIARIVGLRLACQAKLTGTGDVRVDVPPVEDVAARKAAKAERLRATRNLAPKR